MSLQKFKNNSYCVGGRHRSATTYVYGDKTSESSEVLIGQFSICNRKKTLTVSDNRITGERFGGFLKSLVTKRHNVSKKMAKNVLKNPGTARKLKQTLVLQLHPEALKWLYHHNQILSTSIEQKKDCVLGSL